MFDNNMSAYNCYKSVGFRENGLRESYEHDGKDWTVIEMDICKDK